MYFLFYSFYFTIFEQSLYKNIKIMNNKKSTRKGARLSHRHNRSATLIMSTGGDKQTNGDRTIMQHPEKEAPLYTGPYIHSTSHIW